MPEPASAAAREQMLRSQLRRRGITDPRALAAMAKIPREQFVPEMLHDEAYADRALPIDCGQTISQPYIVALMTQALQLTAMHRVLEIGTGSGYQTAVLAELAAEVVSIERHEELSLQAGRRLAALSYRNVTLLVGDGTLGSPAHAPFDRIVVTAAADACPPAVFDQLIEGGILVIPVGGPDAQVLQAICKLAGSAHTTSLCGCRFVPLIGAAGWSR